MKNDPLIQPFAMPSLSLEGRVVMAPMTRNRSPHNIPGSDVAAYYARRAENQVALIITEGTVVSPDGHAYPDVPNFYGDDALAGWEKVVEAVHARNGKIFPQLWHAGSVREPGMGPDPSIPNYGPSAIRHPSIAEGPPPQAMTNREIKGVLRAFAASAKWAQQLGFDGVEIHGAHGYLIDQFFWERTNRRTDGYGGHKIEERVQFAKELIERVRAEVGDAFPIGLRISQWKMGDFDARLAATPQELEKFLIPLTKAGVDIFHCSTRRFFEPEFDDTALNLAGWARKITGKPTISVGSVGLDKDFISARLDPDSGPAKGSPQTIQKLRERMNRGEFDLIAVGRALLADPQWVVKVVDDRWEEITPFTTESLNTLY